MPAVDSAWGRESRSDGNHSQGGKLELAAEKQIEQMTKTYDQQVSRLNAQIEKLEGDLKSGDQKDERLVNRTRSRMQLLTRQRDSMKDMASRVRQSVASALAGGSAGLECVKRATGVAVSAEDLFVALAVDTKRDWYFMMNQNSGNISVLIPHSEALEEAVAEKGISIRTRGPGPQTSRSLETIELESGVRRPYGLHDSTVLGPPLPRRRAFGKHSTRRRQVRCRQTRRAQTCQEETELRLDRRHRVVVRYSYERERKRVVEVHRAFRYARKV